MGIFLPYKNKFGTKNDASWLEDEQEEDKKEEEEKEALLTS